jgi:predicted nucleotidyltransferase
MSFSSFLNHERAKCLQGKFRGVDYFVRCVRDWKEWHEAYGAKRYFPLGKSIVRAVVVNDAESILTPCIYAIGDARAVGTRIAPTQVVSFRGRFCEQVHTGERIRARGKLEKVVDSYGENYRLVIGEEPSDFLISDR